MRNIITEAASVYVENFGNDEGRIDATFEIITLTGWAPDESQQKRSAPELRLRDWPMFWEHKKSR